MGKCVILTLIEGSFEQGFPVILRIREDGVVGKTELQVPGKLPPAPHVLESFKNWQLAYRQMVMPYSRIKPRPSQVTNVSCSQLGSALTEHLNRWLNSGSREWQKIRDRLQRNLSETDEIQVLIETEDTRLQQLPWHLWDLFAEHYQNAEIALSAPQYQPPPPRPVPISNRVRILAILGDSTGINVQQDRVVLEQLPGAEITFLVEPQRQRLNNQLWAQPWDILFFAGHSVSQEDGGRGQISINQSDRLSVSELKNALRRAIDQGLQLAVFNSCDGLGLARELADLHIPQIIVMREPVPDLVAQEFLKHFLITFAHDKSLYLAVREARERLQGLEDRFPCATWLPVIYQNPAAKLPTWQAWRGSTKGDRALLPSKHVQTVLLASMVVTALIIGVRQLGVLQAWELQALDQSLRLRPDEGPDPRLLVVTVTEKDVQNQNPLERHSASLSDRTLAQLLKKLQPYQPQVIGLDVYRDFPVAAQQMDLKAHLQQNQRFIAVCEVGAAEHPGIAAPPEVPENRLSFSDFPVDPDQVIRRQLLGMSKDDRSACATDTSFSFRVAQTYLANKGIQSKRTLQGDLQVGSVVFQKLAPDSGSYYHLDTLGYQVMLNYRSSDLVAKEVTLSSILSNSIDAELPKLVKDRIVLIGTTAKSFKDYFATPYSLDHWPQEMPGIMIQAHMVSQVLSAVLEQRPLLWWLPQWGETLWVWGWSLAGGVLAWRLRGPLNLGLASGVALFTLSGLCFVFLLKGGWVPFVPSALALVVTGGSVVAYTVFQARQKRW